MRSFSLAICPLFSFPARLIALTKSLLMSATPLNENLLADWSIEVETLEFYCF